jgi:hypothetical protein
MIGTIDKWFDTQKVKRSYAEAAAPKTNVNATKAKAKVIRRKDKNVVKL